MKGKTKVAQHAVRGVLQARTPQGMAVPFSTASSHCRDRTRSPALQADSSPAEPPGSPFPFLLSSVLLAVGLTFYSFDVSPAHTHTEVNYTLLVEERSIILNYIAALTNDTHTSFYCTLQILNLFFCKLKVCGNHASGQSIGASFPTASAHFVGMSHFGSLVIFLNLSCLYMISDL